MNPRVPVLACVVVLTLSEVAFAERPPQDKRQATVIFTGQVERVDETWDLETDHYVVWVRVTAVERGHGVSGGDLFAVTCFRRARPVLFLPGASGHSAVPTIGDTIRAYANPSGASYEGNYGLMFWSRASMGGYR